MSLKTLREVRHDPNEEYGPLDLEKLLGQRVKSILGHATIEFGRDVPVFQLTAFILEDGTNLWIEGEHDLPYIPNASVMPNGLSDEQLLALYDEENS